MLGSQRGGLLPQYIAFLHASVRAQRSLIIPFWFTTVLLIRRSTVRNGSGAGCGYHRLPSSVSLGGHGDFNHQSVSAATATVPHARPRQRAVLQVPWFRPVVPRSRLCFSGRFGLGLYVGGGLLIPPFLPLAPQPGLRYNRTPFQ